MVNWRTAFDLMWTRSASRFCAIASCRLRVVALSSLMIAGMLFASVQSRASPVDGEATVSGIIDALWLESDRCYFRISIYWSSNGAFNGESVDAIGCFLNESTGRYEVIPSSQGWKTGDEVNSTLEYTYDEYGRCYWIMLTSKSDENFAEPFPPPLSFIERHPFVTYALAIVAVFVVGQILFQFVFRMKRVPRSAPEEWGSLRLKRRI